MMQTNLQLDLAFNYLENTGTNIFLTGKAGTGKTTFLKKLKDFPKTDDCGSTYRSGGD